MKKNLILITFVVTGLLWGACGNLFAAAPSPVQVGSVMSVKGEVKSLTPPDTATHALKNGDPVFMGDKVETGSDGQLQIQLLDKTLFTLGVSSAMTVDEFVYDPATDIGKVKANMASGIFRIISGKIAHKQPENMVVNLPAGSMGFRGTDVVGIINGTRTEIMLLGPVGTGRIYVTNLVNGQVVTVDVDQAGYATIVDGPNIAPVTIFQVTQAELAEAARELGLSNFGVEGYTPPDVPDPTNVDTNVRNEETARDISPTS